MRLYESHLVVKTAFVVTERTVNQKRGRAILHILGFTETSVPSYSPLVCLSSHKCMSSDVIVCAEAVESHVLACIKFTLVKHLHTWNTEIYFVDIRSHLVLYIS
jgi:hypothetical protein